MKPYSTTIIINASQEALWKVLSDVSHWHEWTPTVSKVEVLDQPELKLGNRYKVYQPKLQPAVWTMTVLTPHLISLGSHACPVCCRWLQTIS